MKHDRTRDQILTRLREAPAKVSDLASALGISRVAVHRHLESLQAEGLVQAETCGCQGPGRPALVFRAVKGESEYAGLCLLMLAQIRQNYGSAGVTQLIEAGISRLFDGLDLSALPLADRVKALVAFVRAQGYQAEFSEAPDAFYIRQHRCPALDVTRENPEFCASELCCYARVLNAEVEQQSRIAAGQESCTYRIPKNPDPASDSVA